MPVPYLANAPIKPPPGTSGAYTPGNPAVQNAGDVATTTNNPWGGQLGAIGLYNNYTGTDKAIGSSMLTGADYKDYEKLGTMAQGYGQYAQNALNDPRAQAAVNQQQTLAQNGMSTDQANALSALGQSARGLSAPQQQNMAALGLLGQSAGGQGPNAQSAGMQLSNEAAIQQQMAAASGGRPGMTQAMAQQQAAANLGGQQLANANQAAQARAASVGLSQQQFANAANQAVGTQQTAANQMAQEANTAYQIQNQNALQAAASAQNEQQMAQNYYLGQQGQYIGQQQQAENMALALGDQQQRLGAIANANYLADQQNKQQMYGIILSSVGSGFGAAAGAAGGGGGGGNTGNSGS